ncbi:MAG: type II toxin-antitoxin system VapC family toxin [Gammaproteobacteria bacterium]|nr:type II toxin-antitoxin system VapC family toxin [Gammaproteobacteria bacterium]
MVTPLLLDTHIWLWSLLDTRRLSPNALDLLASDAVSLHLSSISIWETLLLAERGRLELSGGRLRWIRGALSESPVTETPITNEVALASRSVRLAHEDPADRFIAASAKVFGLTLLTADQRLLACPDIDSVSSRP